MDEFEIVLTQMPYVGGAASRMSDFFMRLMGFMAIGRVLRRHGVALPVIGDIERETYKAQLLTVPEAERLASGRQFMSQRIKPCCASRLQKAIGEEYPEDFVYDFVEPAPATALNSASTTRLAASANSRLATGIKKSCRTFAGLISRPMQRVAFVWNGPKRWLAARATAIFGSRASKQSRTCKASASGRQRRSAGLFRARSRYSRLSRPSCARFRLHSFK